MKEDNRSCRIGCPPMSPEAQETHRANLAGRGALARFNDVAAPLETAIAGTALCLYEFFHINGYMIFRSEWEGRKIARGLGCYQGWVYAFYGEDESPIYVGETSRSFLERFGEHIRQSWWLNWTQVKVLPCPNQSMRKIFESLIGLAGGYAENKNQPTGSDNIFDEVILSLLLLGNDRDTMPAFPNQMIVNHVELLRSTLE